MGREVEAYENIRRCRCVPVLTRRSTNKHHIKGPAKRTQEDDLRSEESFEKMIRKVKAMV